MSCAVFAVTRELYTTQDDADPDDLDSASDDDGDEMPPSARKGKGKSTAPSPADTPHRKRVRIAARPDAGPPLPEHLALTSMLLATRTRYACSSAVIALLCPFQWLRMVHC
jgi:hypothetical protein